MKLCQVIQLLLQSLVPTTHIYIHETVTLKITLQQNSAFKILGFMSCSKHSGTSNYWLYKIQQFKSLMSETFNAMDNFVLV